VKVQNVSVFMGNMTPGGGMEAAGGQKGNKTVYAGNLNKIFDPVEEKRRQARAQAMKVVGDARAADKKIEQDIQKRRDKIAGYKEDLKTANKELKWFAEEREALREAYGVSEDSVEQQDLKLLEKRVDAKRGGSQLTKKEWERLAEIDAAGLTEYQKRSMEMYEESRYYDDMKKAAEQGIEEESRALEAIRKALLKSKGMLKAQEQAEQIMEEASDRIIGMLMEEAKEHIDEEMEEKTEAAKEKAKEKEEEEERLKEIKEEREEKEAFAEQLTNVTEYMVDLETTMGDVQKEIKKITEEMKLLEEDLKGAAVDAKT